MTTTTTPTTSNKKRVKTTHRNNNERVMLSCLDCQLNRFIEAPTKQLSILIGKHTKVKMMLFDEFIDITARAHTPANT